MTHWIPSAIILTLIGATDATAKPADETADVRLVLQLTVDQLRGDMPGRFAEQFGSGGLRYLLDEGIHFTDAHYLHANTETIVGHSTLATGAHPSAHGMIGNIWYDRASDRPIYNIEDDRYQLVGEGGGVDRATEIDPTQKVASSEGRSPTAILVSTLGDELSIATAGAAKVFGVSVKDRAAVSMAGHVGTAYWFSKAKGEFVTSTYYRSAYPEWVLAWNRAKKPFRHAGQSWQLARAESSYLHVDDRPWEVDLGGYGRTFPHPFGPADGKYFTTRLTVSPVGDELTTDFAKALIDAEEIGADDVPDYLSVSYSATDYIGHMFGPSSREAEDNILRLDRTIADLLAFIDDRVGLAHTLIVLSADHGGPEVPGYLSELGLPAAYVDTDAWNTAPGIAALEGRFGLGRQLIRTYSHPYVVLDRQRIRAAKLDPIEIERAVAVELMKLDGVALAISSTALRRAAVPDSALMRAVLNNFHPKRSGDVFVVFEPHRFINDFDGLEVAATHGSPWTYDTYVPILFAGAGIAPRTVHRRVAPNDIAPTLAAFLGIKPPSAAAGRVLVEVVAGRPRR